MNSFIPIFFCIGVALLCIAAAVIIHIRSGKSALGKSNSDFIERAAERKKRKLAEAGGGVSFNTYVALLLFCPAIMGIVGYLLTRNAAIGAVLAMAAVLLPETAVRVISKRQKALFEERYARALRLLASSLRANMTIQQAAEDAGSNIFIHESIRAGFRQITVDLKVGMSVKDAFERFARLYGNKDAWDVAAAISLQSEVGGSEAFVVSSIAQNINDRIMLRKEIRSLFADTSVMILAMDVLPFIIIAALYFYAPQYIVPYFENAAMTVLFFGLLGVMLVGSYVIRRMSRSAKEGA